MSDKSARTFPTETIRHECSQSNLLRAQNYFQQKRLIEFNITQDNSETVTILSKVKGTQATPYRQIINIKWQPDQQNCRIIGQCSCPMGYNCKHVATACLEYQQLVNKHQPLDSDACFAWLDSFKTPSTEIVNNNDQKEFLVYLLSINPSNHSLQARIQITRYRVNGDFAKPRDINMVNIKYALGYGQNLPYFVHESDQEILKLLLSSGTVAQTLPIRGWTGGIALAKMLRCGRLFCDKASGKAVTAGPARPLTFNWELNQYQAFQLSINTKPEAVITVTEPMFYIDFQQKKLGEIVNLGLDHKQLIKLLNAPPVPQDVAQAFSDRLLLEFPLLNIPTPTQVDLIEENTLIPTAKLTLSGKSASGGKQNYYHQIELGFDYGSYYFSNKTLAAYSLAQTDSGYVRVKRDTVFEQACLETFTDSQFLPDLLDNAAELRFASLDNNGRDDGQAWYDFLNLEIPALRSEGWQVDFASSFLLDFQTGELWEAELNESDNDWFEMRFSIEIDGKKLQLLPLLTPILSNYDLDNLPEKLTVALADHQYLTFASDKLKPFLTVIYELFDHHSIAAGDFKFSRYDLGNLAQLETHSYGLFSLKGATALRELSLKIQNFSGITQVEPPSLLQAELRNYQLQGLSWLQFLREYQFAGILADDMGLGKTLQTLAHLLLEKQAGRMILPSLIIAPTSLMSNWRREAQRFTPDLKVLVLQGLDRKNQFANILDYDVVLTTYPLLPRDESFLLEHQYYYVILDEAQVVKNPSAKAAKVVRFLKAQHRLCLTGTPMENHLGELWTQFDFLMPGFLGDRNQFRNRYRNPIELQGDTEQRQRLYRRIKPFLLRRTKQAVLAELPAKTEIIRSVPLTAKQAALYETIRLTMEEKVRLAIAEKGLARSHITILEALLKLRQTCCDPRILPLAEAKKLNESAKLDLLMEMLPELLEEGRRILLFSQFTRMLTVIENELKKLSIDYCKLTGQTRDREQVIEQFKSGAASVFLISLKAGGVGLNLTEADTVIIYDPWWNPAAETQAADRAYRIGQDKPVFVYKLITENTVEEKILAMQHKKRLLAEALYDSNNQQEAALQLTADDLSELFASGS